MTTEENWVRASTGFGDIAIDPRIGNIRALTFRHRTETLAPLHTAPWVTDGTDVGEAPPVERSLSGDFLCAPFGASDVEEAPPHGWTANSAWTVVSQGGGGIRLRLDRPVLGARIEKRVRLSDAAPILFQEHVITGGEGGLTVAHHPMVSVKPSARVSFSPKKAFLTGDALEEGRNRLAEHATADHHARLPGADGNPVDVSRVPIAQRSEDFLTMVEQAGAELGWTAVVRDEPADIIFILKDPGVLPVTGLWHSNAGRDYPPWSGRHDGVLGIEDGCNAGASGHAAALRPNPISALGVPTSLPLSEGATHTLRHVIGAIGRPPGWTLVDDISIAGSALILTDAGGATLKLPFAADFFSKGL